MAQLERTEEQEFEQEAYQPKALLPFMKRVPAKRVVHLPEAARDPVEFSLSFNESLLLPQGIANTQLANYHVTGEAPLTDYPLLHTFYMQLAPLITGRCHAKHMGVAPAVFRCGSDRPGLQK